jgi:hypothetical protein
MIAENDRLTCANLDSPLCLLADRSQPLTQLMACFWTPSNALTELRRRVDVQRNARSPSMSPPATTSATHPSTSARPALPASCTSRSDLHGRLRTRVSGIRRGPASKEWALAHTADAASFEHQRRCTSSQCCPPPVRDMEGASKHRRYACLVRTVQRPRPGVLTARVHWDEPTRIRRNGNMVLRMTFLMRDRITYRCYGRGPMGSAHAVRLMSPTRSPSRLGASGTGDVVMCARKQWFLIAGLRSARCR